MVEEHVSDLLPGYALGSLDEEDLLKVARHLPHCAACRAELESYALAVDGLAQAVPLRMPPAGLRARVVAGVERAARSSQATARQQVGTGLVEPVRQEHTTSAQTRDARPVRSPQTRSGWNALLAILSAGLARPAGLAVGGLAVLLVLFLGISNLVLWQRVSSLEARTPQDEVRIVRMARTDYSDTIQGYMVVFPGEEYGTLVVNDAPVLDAASQYQIWLIRDGKRTSGGVFSVDEHGYGAHVIEAAQPLDTFQSFGVTVEPAGGSPGPTGQKVLGGDL